MWFTEEPVIPAPEGRPAGRGAVGGRLAGAGCWRGKQRELGEPPRPAAHTASVEVGCEVLCLPTPSVRAPVPPQTAHECIWGDPVRALKSA